MEAPSWLSLVMLTMKSARLPAVPAPAVDDVGRNIRATSGPSMSSKQIGLTNRQSAAGEPAAAAAADPRRR